MAKCEKRELRPVPPPVEYVLRMTEDEAEWLCSAMRVWTNPYAQLIREALEKAAASRV